MSISVQGFKGRKNLFQSPESETIKNKIVHITKEMFLKMIASNIDALMTHYRYCKDIDEVMKMVGSLNSIEYLVSEFKEYPDMHAKLNIHYESMKNELTDENCFNFLLNYIKISNELDSMYPNQRLTYVSNNLVNINVMEYEFRDYSIYQFFYGSLDLGNLLNNQIVKISKLKNYAYYNNTDKPKNIKERVWRKREKDWNEIIKRCGSYFSWCPENSGKKIHIADIKNIDISFDEVKKYRSTIERNLQILVKKIMMKDFYKIELEKLLKENGYQSIKELNESKDFSLYTYAFIDSSEFVKEQIESNSEIYTEYLSKIKKQLMR